MFVSSLLSVKFTSFLALGRCYFVGGRGGSGKAMRNKGTSLSGSEPLLILLLTPLN